MYVNGQRTILPETVFVSEFLKREGYDAQRVAVEKNGEIVPKRFYESETLSDGDKIEIVHFVGGG